MTEFYDFAQKTLHPAGIAQLQLDSNGSWMVFLQDGVLLYLVRRLSANCAVCQTTGVFG